jgi:hypothetical protein
MTRALVVLVRPSTSPRLTGMWAVKVFGPVSWVVCTALERTNFRRPWPTGRSIRRRTGLPLLAALTVHRVSVPE